MAYIWKMSKQFSNNTLKLKIECNYNIIIFFVGGRVNIFTISMNTRFDFIYFNLFNLSELSVFVELFSPNIGLLISMFNI